MKSYILLIYLLISCEPSAVNEDTLANGIKDHPGKFEQVQFQNGTINFSGTFFFLPEKDLLKQSPLRMDPVKTVKAILALLTWQNNFLLII